MSLRFYFDIQIEYFGVFFRIDANSWWFNKFAYQLINNSFAHLSQEKNPISDTIELYLDIVIISFIDEAFLHFENAIPKPKTHMRNQRLFRVSKTTLVTIFADDLESEEKKSTNSCYISEQRLCKETVVFELSHSKTFRIRMYHSFFCRIVSVCKHIFLRRRFYVLLFVTHRHTHSRAIETFTRQHTSTSAITKSQSALTMSINHVHKTQNSKKPFG